jgi:hypothetical protein
MHTSISEGFRRSLQDASIHAPELPEDTAYETLEALEEYERLLILPTGIDRTLSVSDYEKGSATKADQLVVLGRASNPVLVTAEHATDPYNVRLTRRGGVGYHNSDHGTAGLAALLAEDNAQSIIPIGRQTHNVAIAPDLHPLKVAMAQRFGGKAGSVALHGMAPGKLLSLTDDTEIHAVIGLGLTPNDVSREVAETIKKGAKDLGLRVTIGNDTEYFVADMNTGGYKYRQDDPTSKYTGRLMAPNPEMTTNFAYKLMKQIGTLIPSVQVEISSTLRLTPHDFYGSIHGDRKSQAMNVYLGYLLAKCVVNSLGAKAS